MPQKSDRKTNEKPLSLHPLSVREALRQAMQADPEHQPQSKPKKKTPRRKK